MTVIVEMAGIPGAGKTTLRVGLLADSSKVDIRSTFHQPIEGLRRRGLVERGSRWARYVVIMVQYRGALLIALRAISAGSRSYSQRIQALRLLTATLGRYESMRRSRAPGIVVLDEGVVQRCFLVFVEAGGVTTNLLEEFLRRCPAPDAVVLLEVEPAEALRRTSSRTFGLPPRLEDLESSEALERLAEGARLLADATKYLALTRRTAVIQLRSDGYMDAGEVAARIRRLSEGS